MSDEIIPQTDTEAYEELRYGIARRYLEGGRIFEIKTQGDMSREAIDAWAGTYREAMQRWPKGQNVFILSDLSHKNQGINPYGQKKANEVYTYLPTDVRAFVATILPNTIIYRLITLFIQQRREKHILHRMFMDREAGLIWLKEMLAKFGSEPSVSGEA